MTNTINDKIIVNGQDICAFNQQELFQLKEALINEIDEHKDKLDDFPPDYQIIYKAFRLAEINLQLVEKQITIFNLRNLVNLLSNLT